MPINYKDFRPFVNQRFLYQAPKTVTTREARLLTIIDGNPIRLKLEIKDVGVVYVDATMDVLKRMKRNQI